MAVADWGETPPGFTRPIAGQYLTSGNYKRIIVDSSGRQLSQIAVEAIVDISGDPVRISGERIRIEGQYPTSGDWRPIAVDASGEIKIEASITVKISGDTVIGKISGETITLASGPNIQISGQTIKRGGHGGIKTGELQTITGVSGGEALTGTLAQRVILKNISGNAPMFVGGAAVGHTPYSGRGYQLTANEQVALNVTNANLIRVYATKSGNMITYITEV